MHSLQCHQMPMAHQGAHVHEHGGAWACRPRLLVLMACSISQACQQNVARDECCV